MSKMITTTGTATRAYTGCGLLLKFLHHFFMPVLSLFIIIPSCSRCFSSVGRIHMVDKMISKVCLACFFFCCVLNWESSYVLGLSKQEREQELLSKLLDQSHYDKRVRPNGINDTRPTIVNVNLYVRSFDMVDENKMEYGMQLTFRQQWLDGRLAYENNNDTDELRYLTLIDLSQVWIPDLFFSNEKSAHQHQLMKPNHYIRIFPNGELLYSTRISLVLSCPMLMKPLPFDAPTCSMRMASYGYTTEDIIFEWKAVDPVQVSSALVIPKFSLEKFTTDHCDSTTNTGTYSCLRVDFSLRRDFNRCPSDTTQYLIN